MYPSEYRSASCLLTLTYQSLEQVPITGRWRFMNTSPKFEAKVRPSKLSFPSLTLDIVKRRLAR